MPKLDTPKDPTITEHLYHLPEPHRSKALYYAFLCGRHQANCVMRVPTIKRALAAAFNPSETPEGYVHWFNVIEMIGNPEPMKYQDYPDNPGRTTDELHIDNY